MIHFSPSAAAKLGLAAATFAAGLAVSLFLTAPTARPSSAACTLVCLTDSLPTTLPSLPTTVPTLPTTVLTTTTGQTTTDSSGSGSSTNASGQGTLPAETNADPPSTPAGSRATLALSRVRVVVRRVAGRRVLVVAAHVNQRATARLRLAVSAKRTFQKRVVMRAGKNTHRFGLPAGVRAGMHAVTLRVWNAAGDARVVRLHVRVPR